jgi:hypothetical protein
VWIKCIGFVHFIHIFYLSFDNFVITVAKIIKKYYNKVGGGRLCLKSALKIREVF